MKTVLVTGATGFLGKYVVDELVEHGYQVRAFGRNSKVGRSLENSSVSFFQGDLTKADDVLEACKGMDLVVHAGALSTVWGPWEDFYQANVLGTKYVLEACRQTGIQRLVYVSSPSIYAAPKDQLAIKESDAPEENNLNNYIRSKLASEKLFKDYPDVPSIILRAFWDWGYQHLATGYQSESKTRNSFDWRWASAHGHDLRGKCCSGNPFGHRSSRS